jgi:putative aldouronate transport system permease protein
MRKNIGRKVFLSLNTGICCIMAFACLAPIIHIFATSFSSKESVMAGRIGFIPVGFTLENYHYVMRDAAFFTAFGVSVIRTILALMVQLAMTVLAAYPISLGKRLFHARSFYTWYFLIAILFSGGLVPTYLVVRGTGLIDTIWALVLPGAVPLFYVILMQNYMKSLPDEIRESAAMDGAGQWRILTQIILPLCRVSIATISLFIIVNNWNAWYDGMLYINDYHKFPLQTYLRTVVIKPDLALSQGSGDISMLQMLVSTGGADAAKIFIAMIPIFLVYPFAQKHFVKGIVLGSVKG